LPWRKFLEAFFRNIPKKLRTGKKAWKERWSAKTEFCNVQKIVGSVPSGLRAASSDKITKNTASSSSKKIY
jgi:hypothetical protein